MKPASMLGWRCCVWGAVGAFAFCVPVRAQVAHPGLAISHPSGLATEGDIKRGLAILSELARDSMGKSYNFRGALPDEIGRFEPELALHLARETNIEFYVPSMALNWANHDPEEAVLWSEKALARRSDGLFWYQTAQVLPVLKRHAPARAQEVWQEAKAAWPSLLRSSQTGKDERELFECIQLLCCAALTKQPEARLWKDVLWQVLGDKGEKGHSFFVFALESLAQSAPAFAIEIAPTVPEKIRAQALGRAMPFLVAHDLNRALDVAELIRTTPENATDNTSQRSDANFNVALKAIFQAYFWRLAQGRKPSFDLDKATRMTAFVTAAWNKDEILALAARTQPPAVRDFALRRLLNEGNSETETRGRIVLWLFEELRQNEARVGDIENFIAELRDEPDLLFALGWIRPAGARDAIEAKWKQRLEQQNEKPDKPLTEKEAGKKRWRDGYALRALSLAMASADFERALALAHTIEGEHGFEARRKLAQFALAPETLRREIFFEQWSFGSHWRPATPFDHEFVD